MPHTCSTRFTLLRHGEPEGGRMYRGRGTDHPLTECGWQQMWDQVNQHTQDWDYIISSPMLRCIEFAKALSQKKEIPCYTEAQFIEAGYGVWEGKTPQELKAMDETAYWNFFIDPVNQRPTNSEPLDVFFQRVTGVFESYLENYAGKHLLIISHLGILRVAMQWVLDAPLASQQRISSPYASMVEFIQDRKGLRLVI